MRAPALLCALPAVLATACTAPLREEINWNRVDLARERTAIEAFQAHDQKLQDVGWKLVRGNAGICARTIPAVGLQLQDMASYGSPAIARRALGLARDFAVQTAAAESPAGQSGAFRPNREIAALSGTDPNQWEAGARFDWERLARAHDHVDAVLADRGALTVAFADGGEAALAPVPVCATRFELMGEGRRAVADGNRVVIGIRFPAFAYPEDMFAGVVAHELAHNLLGHSDWLDHHGRRQGNVRRAEREADRLMPWLLANAGYDPEAALRFMQEWGPRHSGGILRERSHDGWDERAEFIAAELPAIQALLEESGKADWSVHFRREIAPLPAASSEQGASAGG
ncbi:hypothetical protein [Qipengyuania nanhaisediminis]|uniref:hypothetical protein n=1 Tax=Qipengyuania nanhaisediminis TaxID=604088 RepID=UPI0038B3BCB7